MLFTIHFGATHSHLCTTHATSFFPHDHVNHQLANHAHPHLIAFKDLWDTILAMKESGSTRKPGWSIEGSDYQWIICDPCGRKRKKKK